MLRSRQRDAMRRALVSLMAAGVAVAAAGLVVTGSAAGFNPTPEPPRVVPLDGAHWMAGAGFPDATGQSSLGLVQTPAPIGDTHTRVAEIHHLPGTVTELGFAAQTPSGINPCWLVGITNPDGSTSTLHLTTDSARVVSEGPPSTSDSAPYIQRTWSLSLPAGAVVTSATAEVMSGQQPPASGERVAFDRFSINGQVIATP